MGTATVRQTATFSVLLRSPKDVVAAAERGEVTITRRDGEDLVLTTAASARRNRDGLALASSIIAAAVAVSPETFAGRLRVQFPWMTSLSETEQEMLAAEVVDLSRACAAGHQFDMLAIAVDAWQSTAGAYAAGVPKDADWLDNTPGS
jgi:hypothetical protein